MMCQGSTNDSVVIFVSLVIVCKNNTIEPSATNTFVIKEASKLQRLKFGLEVHIQQI